MNALKHGLRAEHVVLPGEDPEEFEALQKGLNEDWRPIGMRECILVEHIACSIWRLRRLGIIETAMMHKEQLALERGRTTERPSSEVVKKLSRWRNEDLDALDELVKKYDDTEETRETHNVPCKISPFRPADQLSKYELQDEELSVGVVYRRLAKDLEMLSRYEANIVRRWRDAERDLEHVQAAREARASATETVIDVTDLIEGEDQSHSSSAGSKLSADEARSID